MAASSPPDPPRTPAPSASAPTAPEQAGSSQSSSSSYDADVVVIGSGPGGYTAAFRAADLGLRTVLVERYASLGGVCLNVGCIPSKALLHAAAVIDEAASFAEHGVTFGKPKIDLKRLNGFKNDVVGRLTKGLAGLAKQRKVEVVTGQAQFAGPHALTIETPSGSRALTFAHAIIAAGSQPIVLPDRPDDPRIWDSTSALRLDQAPKKLLVIGGGIIGLEMATVYASLGTQVTIVELQDQLIPGCDQDLVRPLQARLAAHTEAIHLATRVESIAAQKRGIKVTYTKGDDSSAKFYDAVLVAVGRRPNGSTLNADAAGVVVDERGFIPVTSDQRTNVAHIFAIGDVVGQPMLAHKATHEGKVAAEVIAGHKRSFEPLGIPSVAYTDPEVAWVGETETSARASGRKLDKAVFPWAASGRALGIARSEGLTKLLFDPDTQRIVGAGIVGPHAGDLIAEATLAIEMGADAEDIALTVHPHPTLSETINFAAEVREGSITDLYIPKRRERK